jgi:hypothetical protein
VTHSSEVAETADMIKVVVTADCDSEDESSEAPSRRFTSEETVIQRSRGVAAIRLNNDEAVAMSALSADQDAQGRGRKTGRPEGSRRSRSCRLGMTCMRTAGVGQSAVAAGTADTEIAYIGDQFNDCRRCMRLSFRTAPRAGSFYSESQVCCPSAIAKTLGRSGYQQLRAVADFGATLFSASISELDQIGSGGLEQNMENGMADQNSMHFFNDTLASTASTRPQHSDAPATRGQE